MKKCECEVMKELILRNKIKEDLCGIGLLGWDFKESGATTELDHFQFEYRKTEKDQDDLGMLNGQTCCIITIDYNYRKDHYDMFTMGGYDDDHYDMFTMGGYNMYYSEPVYVPYDHINLFSKLMKHLTKLKSISQ